MYRLLIIVFAIFVIAAGGYIIKEKNFDSGLEKTADVEEADADVVTGAVLDLSGRGLTKAPEYIFNRADIEKLDLSDNELGGALQAEVRHLQKLRVLDLSNNKFTGVPAEIGQLKNLEVLDLSDNLLTGLPYELGNLSKLRLLDLSGNDYSEADLLRIRGTLPLSTIIKTN